MNEQTSLLPWKRLDRCHDNGPHHQPEMVHRIRTGKTRRIVISLTVAAVVFVFHWTRRGVDTVPPTSSRISSSATRTSTTSNSKANGLEELTVEQRMVVWDDWKKFLAFTEVRLGHQRHHEDDPTAQVNDNTAANENDRGNDERRWRKFVQAVKEDWGGTHAWFQKEWNATSSKERQWFHHVTGVAKKDWNSTNRASRDWFHHLARVAKRDWDATAAWATHVEDTVHGDWHQSRDKERQWWHQVQNTSQQDWDHTRTKSGQWWHHTGHATAEDWNKTKETERKFWDGAEHWVQNVSEHVSHRVHQKHGHHDDDDEQQPTDEPPGAPLPVSQKQIPALMYLNHSQAFAYLFQHGLFSRHVHDFDYTQHYFLINQGMDAQINQAYCGVASSAAVLNSFRGWIDLPMDPIYKPHPYATQTSLLGTECTERLVIHRSDTFDGVLAAPGGLSMTSVKALLNCHLNNNDYDDGKSWKVTAHHVDPNLVTLDDMRRDMTDVLRNPMGRMIINFDRKALGQEGGGHFSPIGAYSRHLDAVLMMDVAKYKYPPVWVPMDLLYEALRTIDTCGQWDGPAVQAALPERVLHPHTVPDMAEAMERLGCRETFRGYITIMLEDSSNTADSKTDAKVDTDGIGSFDSETDTYVDGGEDSSGTDAGPATEVARDGDETEVPRVDDDSDTNGSERDGTPDGTDDNTAREGGDDASEPDDDEGAISAGRHKGKHKRKHNQDHDAVARDSH